MENTLPTITDAEWRVMRIAWTLGPTDSHTIIDLLTTQQDWKPATIKTLIGRLVKKGALTTTKTGRVYQYQAAIAEQPAMDIAVTDLFDQMCAMHHGDALAHIIEHIDLSRTDIQSLMTILQAKLATAPEQVACDCLPDGMKGACDA